MTGRRPLDDPNFWDSYAAQQTAIPEFLMRFARRAVAEAAMPQGSSVLDVATGTGAVAVAAASPGLRVLATDFSAAMVAQVASYGLTDVEAREMNGQALDLADASVDAAFSNFGVSLFEDWRAGLSEMARVIRPGGVGSVGAWAARGGAAATLLLSQLCTDLFPDLDQPPASGGQEELREPEGLRAAMTAAGFTDVDVVVEVNDAYVDTGAIADPDRLVTFSPLWPQLAPSQRAQVLEVITDRLDKLRGPMPVPSPALIATARRP